MTWLLADDVRVSGRSDVHCSWWPLHQAKIGCEAEYQLALMTGVMMTGECVGHLGSDRCNSNVRHE